MVRFDWRQHEPRVPQEGDWEEALWNGYNDVLIDPSPWRRLISALLGLPPDGQLIDARCLEAFDLFLGDWRLRHGASRTLHLHLPPEDGRRQRVGAFTVSSIIMASIVGSTSSIRCLASSMRR